MAKRNGGRVAKAAPKPKPRKVAKSSSKQKRA
jgi:hypothetical protein